MVSPPEGRLIELRILFRFKRAEDAKMALEQMEGFELAGRQVCIIFSCW